MSSSWRLLWVVGALLVALVATPVAAQAPATASAVGNVQRWSTDVGVTLALPADLLQAAELAGLSQVAGAVPPLASFTDGGVQPLSLVVQRGAPHAYSALPPKAEASALEWARSFAASLKLPQVYDVIPGEYDPERGFVSLAYKVQGPSSARLMLGLPDTDQLWGPVIAAGGDAPTSKCLLGWLLGGKPHAGEVELRANTARAAQECGFTEGDVAEYIQQLGAQEFAPSVTQLEAVAFFTRRGTLVALTMAPLARAQDVQSVAATLREQSFVEPEARLPVEGSESPWFLAARLLGVVLGSFALVVVVGGALSFGLLRLGVRSRDALAVSFGLLVALALVGLLRSHGALPACVQVFSYLLASALAFRPMRRWLEASGRGTPPRPRAGWLRDTRGLSSVEYVVLLVLIAALVIVGWQVFGASLRDTLARTDAEFGRLETAGLGRSSDSYGPSGGPGAQGNNVPGAGQGNNVPGAGQGNNAPSAGQGNNAPGAGQGNNVPGAGQGNNAPGAGQGNNAPGAGQGNNAPGAGQGNNAPGAGQGNNAPGAGQGNNAPGARGSNGAGAGQGNNVPGARGNNGPGAAGNGGPGVAGGNGARNPSGNGSSGGAGPTSPASRLGQASQGLATGVVEGLTPGSVPSSGARRITPASGGQEIAAAAKGPSLLVTGADIATDFIPGVSNVKDATIALTGVNPVTGEQVGTFGRVVAGVFAVPGMGNTAKYAVKGTKLATKGVVKGAKVAYEVFKETKAAKAIFGWVGRKLGREAAEEGVKVATREAAERGVKVATREATEAAATAAARSPGGVKVIGRQPDTAIAKEWPGHDVLDLPDGAWSKEVNAEWVNDGIKKGQDFYTASPRNGNLIQTEGRFKGDPTIYAEELQQLEAAGYKQVGDYMVHPSNLPK